MNSNLLKSLAYLIIFNFFYLTNLFSQVPNQTLANGINAFNNGDYTLAKEIFNQELSINNQSYLARYYLGLASYKLGEIEDALTEWENIISLGLDRDERVREKILSYFNQAEMPITYSPRSYIKNPPSEKINSFKRLGPISNLKIYNHKLYLVEYQQGRIVEMALDGKEKKILGRTTEIFNILRNPWDLVDTGGSWVVSDFGNDNIFIFDNEFNFQRNIGSRGINKGNLLGPKGLSLDQEGNIYISESGNSRIQVFNPEGESIETFGKLGSGAGEFIKPSDVIYHSRGILVLDNGNRRIQNFTHQYEFLWEWGRGQLKNPNDFLLLDNNSLFILDEKEIFYLNLNNRNNFFPLMRNPANVNDFFLAMAYDNTNHRFYLSNLRNNNLEIYSANDDLPTNYQVNYEKIDLRQFPLVTITLSVKNELNQAVDFLAKEHFKISENGVGVPHVLNPQPNLEHLVFLVEKSSEAKKFRLKTDLFLKEFFKQKNFNSLVRVVSFGGENSKNYQVETPFIRQPLVLQKKILDLLNPKSSPTLRNANLNIKNGLDNSISSLINLVGKKAIIILAYQSYPASVFSGSRNFKQTLNYAKSNHIPIYVFYLGRETERSRGLDRNLGSSLNNLLSNLAESTRGKLYLFNSSRQINDFFNHLKETNNNLYRITYRTVSNPARIGVLRRVKAEVGFLGKYGREELIAYPIPR